MTETTSESVKEALALLARIAPTPWQRYDKCATPREPYAIRDGDGAMIVAILFNPLTMTGDEADANAALIARAPALLQALVEEVQQLRTARQRTGRPNRKD